MEKAQAITAANKVAPNYPDAEKFFVTNDETVFVNDALAVIHAVSLSPGNPEVMELDVDELDFVKPPVKTSEELAAEEKATAIKAAEKKVEGLKAHIKELKNDDEITADNTAEKLFVAELEDQLMDAEIELEALVGTTQP